MSSSSAIPMAVPTNHHNPLPTCITTSKPSNGAGSTNHHNLFASFTHTGAGAGGGASVHRRARMYPPQVVMVVMVGRSPVFTGFFRHNLASQPAQPVF